MLPFRGQILFSVVKQEQYKDVRLAWVPFRLALWTRLYAINTIFSKSFSLLYPFILVSYYTRKNLRVWTKRKQYRTSPKTSELRKHAQTECSSVSIVPGYVATRYDNGPLMVSTAGSFWKLTLIRLLQVLKCLFKASAVSEALLNVSFPSVNNYGYYTNNFQSIWLISSRPLSWLCIFLITMINDGHPFRMAF